MNKVHRILFAVKNPDSRRQAGFEKAVALARSLGASLELFHAISTPVFMDLQPLTGTSLAEIRREALALRTRRLEKMALAARKHHVATTCMVEWDFPPHEAIVRRVKRSKADLIIAECHVGRRLTPWLMHLTDWELLRASPVPVLLLKNARAWQRRPTILAAVDPSHAHAKPSRLDAQILDAADGLAASFRGAVHVMHSNCPAMFGLTIGDPAIDAVTLQATYQQLKLKGKRNFEAYANKEHIARKRRHLIDTDAVFGIPELARKLRADLVVMGAVSRSGLKRVFIGNTAERVLNALPCDVLVVKPAHYEKRVLPKARGMRVVAPEPMFPFPG
ncbi:MAG: universal stress protein [Pseudomonadota bacterium]